MSYNENEITQQLFDAVKKVKEHPNMGEEWLEANLPPIVKGYRTADYLYEPNQALINRINDYKQWCQLKRNENSGQLMEEIALLAFKCLKGWNEIKSYQSYAPQHDLVVSGSELDWASLICYLHLSLERRSIVVEAKNYNKKINDQIFSRLCSILSNYFDNISDLGVFFTRYGASGFPDKADAHRKRKLSNAQATQIIYHAKTGKRVVVFAHDDILELVKAGALPRLLEAKIKEIEEFTGLPLKFTEKWLEIDLPEHLRKHMD